MNNGGFHLNLYENTYSFIIFPLVFVQKANIIEKGRFKWQDIAAIAAGL